MNYVVFAIINACMSAAMFGYNIAIFESLNTLKRHDLACTVGHTIVCLVMGMYTILAMPDEHAEWRYAAAFMSAFAIHLQFINLVFHVYVYFVYVRPHPLKAPLLGPEDLM